MVGVWLVVGIMASLTAFVGWYGETVALFSVVGLLIAGGWLGIRYSRVWHHVSISEWVLVFLLASVWALHALGVFAPETGFDALWYHLPVIRAVTAAGRLVLLPELYQSANPLFSDLVLGLGWILGHELGVKLMALSLAVSLVYLAYRLARLVLNRSWALAATLWLSTFQVIAWQASSFYVDLANALWQLGAVWVVSAALNPQYSETERKKWRQRLWLSGLCLGAAIATKQFSLLLWPLFGWAWFIVGRWSRHTLRALLSPLFIAVPFYVYSTIVTGNPFFSLQLHVNKLAEIGGSTSLSSYLWQRVGTLPTSLLVASVGVKDYTSWLWILLVPLSLVWLTRQGVFKKFIHNPLLVFWVIFVLFQWWLWWSLPPLSTRYALSGFIVLALLSSKIVSVWVNQSPAYREVVYWVLGLAILSNLLYRIPVTLRTLKYLTTNQTQEEYLRQFLDGNVDEHLKRWYRLE